MNGFEKALSRYLSHGQLDKIRSVKIGIAGAGGLGSNCAMALVRTGFRHVRIADFDVIDYSNLNRQFYFADQTSMTKVEALRDNLHLINPNASIIIDRIKLDEENIDGFYADCDVVVEAFDKAEYKRLIVDTYMNSGKLLVAASGLAGWGDSDRIQVYRIRENFYIIGDLITGIGPDTPPLAPCVLIAAAKQADVVLSYALGTLQERYR